MSGRGGALRPGGDAGGRGRRSGVLLRALSRAAPRGRRSGRSSPGVRRPRDPGSRRRAGAAPAGFPPGEGRLALAPPRPGSLPARPAFAAVRLTFSRPARGAASCRSGSQVEWRRRMRRASPRCSSLAIGGPPLRASRFEVSHRGPSREPIPHRSRAALHGSSVWKQGPAGGMAARATGADPTPCPDRALPSAPPPAGPAGRGRPSSRPSVDRIPRSGCRRRRSAPSPRLRPCWSTTGRRRGRSPRRPGRSKRGAPTRAP